MFGFEFAPLIKVHTFPAYDKNIAVQSEAIQYISPLVWQEHCVECAMPACYKTCVHYKDRIDGRCRLFEHGIERIKNKNAILGQNVVIEMNEWAKLETFFFPRSYTYRQVQKMNCFVNLLGLFSQFSHFGKLRRFFYYVKEYVTRRWGVGARHIPDFLLCEIYNDEESYKLNLESRADNQVLYRTVLKVKDGYNRFLIPASEFKFNDNYVNYLCIYPEGNKAQLVNFISLELVSFKNDFLTAYLTESQKKVKCVVWDLDDTLWNGILAEDGVDGIELKENILEIIKSLDAKGIVNSICSKNYEEKAVEALKFFGISEYFVCPVINWNAKSQNIKKISNTLDIGMDTFVFVDDSIFELNEVKINCPDVRVCKVENIEDYACKDFFDVPVTEESRNRRKSYQEIAIRNQDFSRFDDIMEFLKSCNMTVLVHAPSSDELLRCYELIQRTNQLNISAERLSLDEIKDIVESNEYDCYRIKVFDKYGDYGLVGFAVFDISDSDRLLLKHFVISCRVARKKVEQSFFEYIIKIYQGRGFKQLVLTCKRTEKNQLMQTVLEECGLFEKKELSEGMFLLTHNMMAEFTPQKIIRFEEK